MISRWKALTPGERLKYQIVTIALMLGFYGLIPYQISRGDLAESEKMLSRRQNRIETRASLDDLKTDGANPDAVRKKIEAVEDRLRTAAEGLDELEKGFAPVDSDDVRQELMLEISTLAEKKGVTLLTMFRRGVDSDGETTAASFDRETGRPILTIQAATSFWSLIDFLEGLETLSFHATVMNLKLEANLSGKGSETASRVPLSVSMALSI